MARELYSEQLPVVLLEPQTARTSSALQSTAPTSLRARLVWTPSPARLLFTLADLTDSLFLLTHSLDTNGYAAMRDAQALRVDFDHFPHHFAQLLKKPEHNSQFMAVLDFSASSSAHSFEILQLSEFKMLTHVHILMQKAPHQELLAAVAETAREARIARDDANAHAQDLQRTLDRQRDQIETLRNDSATLTTQVRANEVLQREHNELRNQLDHMTQLLDRERNTQEQLRRDISTLQRDRNTAEQEATTAKRARQQLDEQLAEAQEEASDKQQVQKELDDVRAELTQLASKYEVATAEIHKGNSIIERLQTQITNMRTKAKLKTAIIEKQEQAVQLHEQQLAESQREIRRATDKMAMLEVEKDGLAQRLQSARTKLEENATLLASDQQVIAYLNRELNQRAMMSDTKTSSRSSRRRRRQEDDGYRPSSSSGNDSGIMSPSAAVQEVAAAMPPPPAVS